MNILDEIIKRRVKIRKGLKKKKAAERFRKKYHEDPEFRKKRKVYVRVYRKRRYNEDPQFRERVNESARQSKIKKKLGRKKIITISLNTS